VDEPQRAADVLKVDRERWWVSLFGTRLHVISDGDVDMARRSIARELEEHGVRVLNAGEARFSLEDVFIAVVEQARARGRAAARS